MLRVGENPISAHLKVEREKEIEREKERERKMTRKIKD